NRAANQVITRNERGIRCVGRLQDAGIIVGVVAVDEEPLAEAKFGSNIGAARDSQVGVEVAAAEIWIGRRIVPETHDVVEAGVEIIGGKLPAIPSQLLIDAGGPALAGFWLEIRVAWKAGIGAEGLVEARLLDALAVEGPVARVAEKSFAIVQRVRAANTGNKAGTEAAVGFDASAEVERQPGDRRVPEIEIAGLIVAA